MTSSGYDKRSCNWRLDGFVSLDAGAKSGTLLTRPLELDGGPRTVNARVGGELRVEALADGRPVQLQCAR